MDTIEFFVPGKPVTQGSKKCLYGKDGKLITTKTGRPVLVDDNVDTLDTWRNTVSWYARQVTGMCESQAPFRLILTFWRPRRQQDFRTRNGKVTGELRRSADAFPTSRPDSFKMCRAVEDALSKVIWKDDSQIVDHHIYKRFCRDGEQPGVHVVIEIMDNTLQGNDFKRDDAKRAEPTLFDPH